MRNTPQIHTRAGARYGSLTVLDPETRRGKARAALVRCDCGTTKTVALSYLVNGRVVSCGCHRRRKLLTRNAGNTYGIRHGASKHPHYKRWAGIMQRCYNPNHPRFARYGGRGITMHEPWHDPAAFCDYLDAELGPCPPGHTLDRINNARGYEPGNLRWATHSEQNRNRAPYRRSRTKGGDPT